MQDSGQKNIYVEYQYYMFYCYMVILVVKPGKLSLNSIFSEDKIISKWRLRFDQSPRKGNVLQCYNNNGKQRALVPDMS